MASQSKSGRSDRPENGDSSERPKRVARLDTETQAMIGSKLKAMYAEICNEPIPDQLVDLLRELENKETKG